VNDGEAFSTAVNFANNFGLTYPVLHDPSGTVKFSYPMSGLTPYPRDVIVDQNGIIQYMHSEYDPQYMLQTVNNLLGVNEIVDEPSTSIPERFDLQVFPNPFNPSTNVSFNIVEAAPVRLEIYNMLGQHTQTLQLENYLAGNKATISLDLQNNSTGIYFLTITNGKSSETQKLLLLQ